MTRVLIADDDIVVRDVVRRYLERDGLDVSIARDGNEALRLLGSQRIDVAVLDVMMPGPDGLTLCRSLSQRGDYTVPVILLTALGEEDDRIAGLEAGADDYLTKPFSPRELALRVRSVLRRAPSPSGLLPLDITVVSTDMNEDQLGLSRRALSKAIYSPRFSEGRAVSTAGATFTAEWYEESVPPPTPAATQTTAAPASGESSDGGR